VHAVYSGHNFARQLDRPEGELYMRDIPIAEHACSAVFSDEYPMPDPGRQRENGSGFNGKEMSR